MLLLALPPLTPAGSSSAFLACSPCPTCTSESATLINIALNQYVQRVRLVVLTYL